MKSVRHLALIDGEHYPPVVAAALSEMAAGGEVVALLVGGSEKLSAPISQLLEGVRVLTGPDPRAALDRALVELRPDVVVDLSDEPVLGYRKRMELASISLFHGVPYRGAGFSFDPPPRPRLATKPTIAIVGTGKRTGKTAVAGFAARTLVGAGRRPVVVAMGRGGPDHPEVLGADGGGLTPADLVAMADAGRHAASDYIEDALLARVPTVGCRRCGGGLAGGVEYSNVAEGIRMANALPGDVMLLEGSGSALPPAHADATLLVVPAAIPEEYLAGYFGPYRLLLADFVIVTMCEEPFGSPSQISAITSRIKSTFRSVNGRERPEGLQVVRTVFRPAPMRSVEGAMVLVATTAPTAAGESIREHLESQGCRVAGIVHSLSDRARLRAELDGSEGADLLLCEIKAAGVDVATRWALERGLEVVYMDNVPEGIGGDDPAGIVIEAGAVAAARFQG